jgi:hypothetical protein
VAVFHPHVTFAEPVKTVETKDGITSIVLSM